MDARRMIASGEQTETRKGSWFLAVILIFAVLRGLTSSRIDLPESLLFPCFDKLAHLLLFGLVATSLFRLKRDKGDKRLIIILAVTTSILLGVYIEIRQIFIPGRTLELADLFADIAGSVLAVYVYEKWSLYRTILEFNIIPENKQLPRLDDHSFPKSRRGKRSSKNKRHARRRFR